MPPRSVENAGWQAPTWSAIRRSADCPSGSTAVAAHQRRLIARAAVALADDILDALADKPVLKLAQPEEPTIDLNL